MKLVYLGCIRKEFFSIQLFVLYQIWDNCLSVLKSAISEFSIV